MRFHPVTNFPVSISQLHRLAPVVLGLFLFLAAFLSPNVLLAQPGGPVAFPEGNVDNVEVRAMFELQPVGGTGSFPLAFEGILSVNRTDPQIDANGNEQIEIEIVTLDLVGFNPQLGTVLLTSWSGEAGPASGVLLLFKILPASKLEVSSGAHPEKTRKREKIEELA